MQATATLSLPPSEFSPARAREWIDEQFEQDPRALSATRALTSELVSDAIRRQPAQITVQLERLDGLVRVEVADAASGLLDAQDDTIERGLRRDFVEALATRWGSDSDNGRTSVWFEVALEGPTGGVDTQEFDAQDQATQDEDTEMAG